jgi:hypothetical protein
MTKKKLLANLENLLKDCIRWDKEEFEIRDKSKRHFVFTSRATIVRSIIHFL